jgi:hypothetical protein
MATRSTDLNATPAALVSHTMIRIQGEQDGDITVYHACSPNARLRLQWGGMLMTMLSAQAIQGVLEGFSVARQTMALIPRQIPAPTPTVADPFALPTVAIDWTRRPAYAVVPRQELARDGSRQVRWLDLHMGPVTFQILDQAGCLGAVALLRTAHHAAIEVFLDGPEYADDPTGSDYTPPSSG